MAGNDPVLRYVSVSASSRPFQTEVPQFLQPGYFLSSLRSALKVAKGIATVSHANGSCILWKVIYCGFFPLTPFFLTFCPSHAKLAVRSFAMLVWWFWKCLLWEAETAFHQNFPFIFWREINWSPVVKTTSVAYVWEASIRRRIQMVLSVVWEQCLKPFHILKPCHFAERNSCCSLHVLWEGWKASYQCLQNGLLESRDMFQFFWGDTPKEVCCLTVRWCMLTQVACSFLSEMCFWFSTDMSVVCHCLIQTLMLPSLEMQWGFPAFWRGRRRCSASSWHDKLHRCFNAVWDSDGNWSHSFLCLTTVWEVGVL